MQRRFVARKKDRIIIMKVFITFFVACIVFMAFYYFIFKSFFKEEYKSIKNHLQLLNYGLNISSVSMFDILKPNSIFTYSLNYFIEEKNNYLKGPYFINDKENDEKPLVYIYNTHDTEGYDSTFYQAYNLTFTVGTASYILSDYLKDLGIACYVEKESIREYLKENKLLYKDSYKASRYYIQKRMKEYPTIKYIIDIHRDSAPLSTTKITIDDKDYAKMMFVVGLNHANYTSNLKFAEILHSKFDPRLMREISKKNGSTAEGIYNQDLNNSAILVEVGGINNKINEINNSLKIFAEVFSEVIKEG